VQWTVSDQHSLYLSFVFHFVLRTALEVGYRFLDCAQFYGNEKEVGMAIKESNIPRQDLFLASKVWCDNIFRGPSAGALRSSHALSSRHNRAEAFVSTGGNRERE
jgi:diketogulonate reductase-like aldo/keto reductase